MVCLINQAYTYTYIDEKRKKREEKEERDLPIERQVYQKFPDLHLITTDVSQDEIDQNEQHTLFHLNEVFKAEKIGESYAFNNERVVNNFLDKLTQNGDDAKMSVYGEFKNKCNFEKKIHAIWWIYGVNTAHAFERKLKSHSFFKNYEIINIAGDGNQKEETEINNKLKRVDSDSNKEGSIILTHARLLTGSTIERLNSILVLNDCKQPETYLQAIFRPQSPCIDEITNKINKRDVYVFDFSVKRVLNTIMRRLLSNLDKDSGSEAEQEVIDDFDICKSKFINGRLDFEKVSIEDIIEHYSTFSLAKRINTRRSLLNSNWFSNLQKNPELMNIINEIRTYRKINKETGMLFPDEEQTLPRARQESNTRTKEPTSEEDREEAKKRKEKRDKVADKGVGLSVMLADFMYMTKKREKKTNDILANQKQEEVFFKQVTGISTEKFKKLCDPDNGLLNKDELNERVKSFHRKENSSIKTAEFIRDYLNHSKQKAS